MAQGEVMVGVDVSMAQLDVALWPGGEGLSLSNDPPGVEQLLERMLELRPQAVVVEASGGAEDLILTTGASATGGTDLGQLRAREAGSGLRKSRSAP